MTTTAPNKVDTGRIQEKKFLFFDMDGTLTESRTEIDRHMLKGLMQLMYKKKTVSVVSGATYNQIISQVGYLSEVIYMAQSGNDVRQGQRNIWKNIMDATDLLSVTLHLRDVLTHEYKHEKIMPDCLEVRGGQISYSFIGHNADKRKKAQFDPSGAKRRTYLENTPFNHDAMEVNIGGTTCFDYTPKGWNKRGNIQRLIETHNIPRDQCLYIGDQLYKGGNDYTVLGLIPCLQVNSVKDTLKVINTLCL